LTSKYNSLNARAAGTAADGFLARRRRRIRRAVCDEPPTTDSRVIINAYDEREMYAEALRSRGLDVMTVASGAERPAAVTRAQPDALGQRMTFKDGPLVDLAVALENRLSAIRTGLVMLSGFADSPTPIAIM
jgi:hypothetical protein